MLDVGNKTYYSLFVDKMFATYSTNVYLVKSYCRKFAGFILFESKKGGGRAGAELLYELV